MTRFIHRHPRGTPMVLALLAGAVSLPASAADGLQFSTGADYSSGDFGGTTQTEVLVVPISARLRVGDWSLRGTLPYLRISGPADVIVIADDSSGSSSGSGGSSSSGSGRSGGSGGSGSSGSGGSDDSVSDDGSDDRGGNDAFSAGRRVSGLGDATLSLTRSFNALGDTAFYADVTGRVKFATGKASSGLGVGTTDYSAGTELGYAGEAAGLYAAVARRFLGSTASLQRDDGWQWHAGGWVNIGTAVEVGTVYSWREASTPMGINSRDVEVNLGLHLGTDWRATLFASRGLSDGSPEMAGGLNLSWQYGL